MSIVTAPQRRVVFDFEIDFSNGGGLQGQDFRLDWHGAARSGDDVDDVALAAAIVRDLRLLMVGEVRILRKALIDEPHKRSRDDRGAGPRPGDGTG